MSIKAVRTSFDHPKAQVYTSLHEQYIKEENILANTVTIAQSLFSEIESRCNALQSKKTSIPLAHQLEDEHAAYCIVSSKVRDLYIKANGFKTVLTAGLNYLNTGSTTAVTRNQLKDLQRNRYHLRAQIEICNNTIGSLKRSLYNFQMLVANKGKPLNICQLVYLYFTNAPRLGQQAKSLKDRVVVLQDRIKAIEDRVTSEKGMPFLVVEEKNAQSGQ